MHALKDEEAPCDHCDRAVLHVLLFVVLCKVVVASTGQRKIQNRMEGDLQHVCIAN